MSGKGDKYRPVDPQKWATEYERIFAKTLLSDRVDQIKRDLFRQLHGASMAAIDFTNPREPEDELDAQIAALDELTRMAQENGEYGKTAASEG